MKKNLIMLFLIMLLMIVSVDSRAKEFIHEIEKDYKLKSMGQLQLINPKGDISIQGWALDKIRVKFKKRVDADRLETANDLFKRSDYRLNVVDASNIEISTYYGKDLEIEERLKERENPKIRTDLTVYAPSRLNLRGWAVDGQITLKAWSGKVDLRTNAGAILLDGIRSENVSTFCSQCDTTVKALNNTSARIRCVGGSGSIELNDIIGKSIYIETESGPLKLIHVRGDQFYISKSGSIEGQSLRGPIEFHAQTASIKFWDVSGTLSGFLESGNIVATLREWAFTDIESKWGNIQLTLPRQFSAEVDVRSLRGKAQIEFPVEKFPDQTVFGPEPANHLVGRVREGGVLFRILTDTGNIFLLKNQN